jgi:hypothetical protein
LRRSCRKPPSRWKMTFTTLGKETDRCTSSRDLAVAELARLQVRLHITPPSVIPDLGTSYLAIIDVWCNLCNQTDEYSI